MQSAQSTDLVRANTAQDIVPRPGIDCPWTMSYVGYDPSSNVYHWKDDNSDSVWETSPGKKYGYLYIWTYRRQVEAWEPAPIHEANWGRYLVDPESEEYRLDGPMAVVTSGGRQVLRTFPNFIRITKPVSAENQEDKDRMELTISRLAFAASQ
jgi:hypothetical protein